MKADEAPPVSPPKGDAFADLGFASAARATSPRARDGDEASGRGATRHYPDGRDATGARALARDDDDGALPARDRAARGAAAEAEEKEPRPPSGRGKADGERAASPAGADAPAPRARRASAGDEKLAARRESFEELARARDAADARAAARAKDAKEPEDAADGEARDVLGQPMPPTYGQRRDDALDDDMMMQTL